MCTLNVRHFLNDSLYVSCYRGVRYRAIKAHRETRGHLILDAKIRSFMEFIPPFPTLLQTAKRIFMDMLLSNHDPNESNLPPPVFIFLKLPNE